MIKITAIRNNIGLIKGFKVEGHAAYADYGNDIVCAAVSVTAYTALGALQELAELKDFYTLREGYIDCRIPTGLDENTSRTVNTILETTMIGFMQIEAKYKEFVSVLN